MKTLNAALFQRLAAWKQSPYPIHRFLRIDFSRLRGTYLNATSFDSETDGSDGATSGNGWRFWSDHPREVTVGGIEYRPANGLVSVGQTKLNQEIGRSPFAFSVIDGPDQFLTDVAETGAYRGLTVHCDIYFCDPEVEASPELYRDTYYEGALDGVSIAKMESGVFLATLNCASPFASLDEMIGRQGSQEDQHVIDASDTSMDEAIKPIGEDDLRWGQPT